MSTDLEIGQTHDGRSPFSEDPEQSIRGVSEPDPSSKLDGFIAEFSSLPEYPCGSTPGSHDFVLPQDELFKLHDVFAHGGHGEIWRAVQVSLNRRVAVKKVKSTLCEHGDQSTARALERAFYKEALVAAQLDHPTIVPVYDMGLDAKRRPMIAMKLVEGTPWTQMIADDRSRETGEFLAKHVAILISVAHAVAFAHSRNVIHRDLKPSQVIVGNFGEVFLMDWGLAASFGSPDPSEPAARAACYAGSVSQSQSPAGTVCYMAPEQTEATGENLGPWTDIYLLGGILYLILTDTRPHPQSDTAEAFRHAASGVLDPPEERTPGRFIPAQLSRVCMKAMARDPRQRYADVPAMIADLEGYLSGASEKAEAVRLVSSVHDSLLRVGLVYEDYSDAANKLDMALRLWPGNEEALQLCEQVAGGYARRALENNDFSLARIQAMQLSETPERARLVSNIDVAERRQQRIRLQRRLATIAAFVLLFAVGALAFSLITLTTNANLRRLRLEKERTEHAAMARVAAGQREEAARTAEIARLITELGAGEARLAEEFTRLWANEFPYPVTFEYSPYDRDFWNSRDQNALRELVKRRESLKGVRDGLTAKGVPLSPEPFALPYYSARQHLYESGSHGTNSQAYEMFRASFECAPNRPEALMGMAVAAARDGFLTSASRHLNQAARMSFKQRGFRRDYQKLLTLQNELNLKRWSSFAFGPEDLLVEARPVGDSVHRYEEVEGPWCNGDKPAEWARSSAAGMGVQTNRGCRKVITFSPFEACEATATARARFLPSFASTRNYHVYATWAMAANAYPIYYVVRHVGGLTTVTVSQNGWGGEDGNANCWIPLGAYDFAPASGHGVDLVVGDDVEPVTAEWGGQAVADAVLWSPRALPIEMTGPPVPLSETTRLISWHHEWTQASKRARELGRPLLLFRYSPGYLRSHYVETRIFVDPEVARAINASFVPLRVHPHGNFELSWRFRGGEAGTLSIVSADGTIIADLPTTATVTPGNMLVALRDVGGRR